MSHLTVFQRCLACLGTLPDLVLVVDSGYQIYQRLEGIAEARKVFVCCLYPPPLSLRHSDNLMLVSLPRLAPMLSWLAAPATKVSSAAICRQLDELLQRQTPWQIYYARQFIEHIDCIGHDYVKYYYDERRISVEDIAQRLQKDIIERYPYRFLQPAFDCYREFIQKKSGEDVPQYEERLRHFFSCPGHRDFSVGRELKRTLKSIDNTQADRKNYEPLVQHLKKLQWEPTKGDNK